MTSNQIVRSHNLTRLLDEPGPDPSRLFPLETSFSTPPDAADIRFRQPTFCQRARHGAAATALKFPA
jgi:hypothetical protein